MDQDERLKNALAESKLEWDKEMKRRADLNTTSPYPQNDSSRDKELITLREQVKSMQDALKTTATKYKELNQLYTEAKKKSLSDAEALEASRLEVQSLKEKYVKEKGDLESYASLVSGLESDKESLKAQLALLLENRTAVEAKLNESFAANQLLQKSIEEHASRVHEATLQRDMLQKANQQLTDQTEELLVTVGESVSMLQSRDSHLSQLTTEMELVSEKVAVLQQMVDQKDLQISQLKQEANDRGKMSSDDQQTLSELKRKNDDLNTVNQTLVQHLEQMKTLVNDKVVELNQSSLDVSNLSEAMSTQERKIKSLESELAGFKSRGSGDFGSIAIQLTDALEEKQALLVRIEALEQEHAARKKANEVLVAEVARLQDLLKTPRPAPSYSQDMASTQVMPTKGESLESSLVMTQNLTALQQSMMMERSKIESTFQDKINRLLKGLKSSEEARKRATAELADVSRERSHLTKDLADVSGHLDSILRQLPQITNAIQESGRRLTVVNRISGLAGYFESQKLLNLESVSHGQTVCFWLNRAKIYEMLTLDKTRYLLHPDCRDTFAEEFREAKPIFGCLVFQEVCNDIQNRPYEIPQPYVLVYVSKVTF